MLLCFRPRTGDYFLSGYFFMSLPLLPHQVASVPVLGIIFYHKKLTLDIILEVYICFRPRTGDYFLSSGRISSLGGFLTSGFRPRTGDYFLSKDAMIHMGIDFVHEFPSPYWGLFFIPTLYYYDNYGF